MGKGTIMQNKKKDKLMYLQVRAPFDLQLLFKTQGPY
jgi:hypothetical protein